MHCTLWLMLVSLTFTLVLSVLIIALLEMEEKEVKWVVVGYTINKLRISIWILVSNSPFTHKLARQGSGDLTSFCNFDPTSNTIYVECPLSIRVLCFHMLGALLVEHTLSSRKNPPTNFRAKCNSLIGYFMRCSKNNCFNIHSPEFLSYGWLTTSLFFVVFKIIFSCHLILK